MSRKSTNKKGIDIISLDNKPVNKDVIEEKEIIPEKFVKKEPVKVEKKSTIKVHNGRVYKDLSNGYGMYADNGQVFKI